eukprot:3236796-Rhodomonas_salina.1
MSIAASSPMAELRPGLTPKSALRPAPSVEDAESTIKAHRGLEEGGGRSESVGCGEKNLKRDSELRYCAEGCEQSTAAVPNLQQVGTNGLFGAMLFVDIGASCWCNSLCDVMCLYIRGYYAFGYKGKPMQCYVFAHMGTESLDTGADIVAIPSSNNLYSQVHSNPYAISFPQLRHGIDAMKFLDE